jgi:predicted ATPase
VFDNVEQIVDSLTPLLSRWAIASTRATLIVTSRVLLRAPGAHCVALTTLETPAPQEQDPEAILATDAVRLLCARAAAYRGPYDPETADVAELAAIARAVDGIPLALELCAARLGLLGAREVRARVEAGIAILSRSARGAAPRHASLSTAIEGSWRLLSGSERDALVRLSAARGAIDLDAATALILGDPSSAHTSVAIETLATLHEHSLLVVEDHEGGPRYRVYEPVRAFVAERTDHTATDARDRHARFFVERTLHLARTTVRAARRALLPDMENVLLACEHLLPGGRGENAAGALAALAPIYVEGLYGPLDSYLERLTRALDRSARADEEAVARMHLARGEIQLLLGNGPDAERSFERARGVAESAGLPQLAAEALIHIARQRSVERRPDAASSAFAEAIARVDPSADAELAALLAFQQGNAALRELRLDEARHHLRDASNRYMAIGDRAQHARAAANGALAHIHAGRYEEALELADDGLASARVNGLPRIECELLSVRAHILALLGRLEESEAVTEQAMVIARSLGLTWLAQLFQGGLTVTRMLQGRFAEALASLTEVEAAYRATGDLDRTAMIAARQAVAASELGRGELARERLEAARPVTGSRSVADVVRVAEAHVELALVRAGPDERATASAADRARATLTDPSALNCADARVLRACLAQALGPVTDELELVVGRDARWFRTPAGERVALLRRRAVRLMLDRLVQERLRAPGAALSIETLFAAGWPGERASERSARNRVHVTLTRMKDLGLRGVIQSRDDGVLIAPHIRVVREADR